MIILAQQSPEHTKSPAKMVVLMCVCLQVNLIIRSITIKYLFVKHFIVALSYQR